MCNRYILTRNFLNKTKCIQVNKREKKIKATHTSAFVFFFLEVEGPGWLVGGASITICPVIEDKELFVCRPGNLIEVGGIFVIKLGRLSLFRDKSGCKIFSLFDKQLF